MPSFTFVATLQSQLWCNVPIELSDVSLNDASMPVTEKLYERANPNTLFMPVNLWSGCSKIDDYNYLHEATGANILYDSASAFGVEYDGKKLGGRGIAEVFSFHATKIINATEGGVITTNNDDLARKIRAKVPSYPASSFESDRVANCRFSEAQAAMALLSLADFEKNVARNKKQFDMYVSVINSIKGLSVWHPANCTRSNYATLVVIVDEITFGASRDKIISHLKAENIIARRYYFPGIHQVLTNQTLSHLSETMQNTDRLCQTAMQLPLGGLVSTENIQAIADIIIKIRHFYS
jgi:dTDP-4-amino-4,6-dideoxygalactose transaminase